MVESIVMGCFPRGLYHPYARRLSAEFVETVQARIIKQNASCFEESAFDYLKKLAKTEKEVEIFGIYENACVAHATLTSLALGLNVRVPLSFTQKTNLDAEDLTSKVKRICSSSLEEFEDDQYQHFKLIEKATSFRKQYLGF